MQGPNQNSKSLFSLINDSFKVKFLHRSRSVSWEFSLFSFFFVWTLVLRPPKNHASLLFHNYFFNLRCFYVSKLFLILFLKFLILFFESFFASTLLLISNILYTFLCDSSLSIVFLENLFFSFFKLPISFFFLKCFKVFKYFFMIKNTSFAMLPIS